MSKTETKNQKGYKISFNKTIYIVTIKNNLKNPMSKYDIKINLQIS